MSFNEEGGRTASIDGRNIEANGAEFGLKMTVIGPTRGAISLSNSIHLLAIVGSNKGKSCDMAARPVKARDEAAADRIGSCRSVRIFVK